MLKMIAIFRDGILIDKLPALAQLIKDDGGEGYFVPDECEHPHTAIIAALDEIDDYLRTIPCEGVVEPEALNEGDLSPSDMVAHIASIIHKRVIDLKKKLEDGNG
jgi:hypothetical protein